MNSIRKPFFASAVATVDRVLAAQVTSIFSTQILNNLTPEDINAVNFYKAENFNLLGAVNSTVNLFTVPENARYIASDCLILITESTVNGAGTVTTPASIRLSRSSDNANLNNPLTLRTSTYNVNDVDKQSAYISIGLSAPSGDIVQAKISTAMVQGATPRYTSLIATVIVNGFTIRT